MRPDVTIGIATFCAANLVSRAVESALAQTGISYEIVIVDDCSSDNTWEIISEWADKNKERIRIFRHDKNQGVASVRNTIIDRACGEFLVFFDDDDVSDPDRVVTQINSILECEKKLKLKENFVLCHTARNQIYPDGRSSYVRTMGDYDCGKVPCGTDVVKAILFNTPVIGGNGAMATCSQAGRVSTYRALGGFDVSLRRSEDTDFCLRLARAGGTFIGLRHPYVTQYMTVSPDKKIYDERRFAVEILNKNEDILRSFHRGRFDYDWLDLKHDYLEKKRVHFFLRSAFLFLKHPILTVQKFFRALPNWSQNRRIRDLHKTGSDL